MSESILDFLRSPDFIAGSISGSIGIIATQPMDVVRIRMQIPSNQGKSIMSHIYHILKSDGPKGLFRGVASPTLTVSFMTAILFQSFESSKAFLQRIRGESPYRNLFLSYIDQMIAGFYAGFVSCFITSPTELIKCVCQLEEGAESATIKNELRVALRITSQYGFFRGLWRGFHVTVIQTLLI